MIPLRCLRRATLVGLLGFACIQAPGLAQTMPTSRPSGESTLGQVFDQPDTPLQPALRPTRGPESLANESRSPESRPTQPRTSPASERLPLGPAPLPSETQGLPSTITSRLSWLTGPMLSLAAVLGVIAIIAGLMRLIGRHRAESSLRAEIGSGGRAPSGLMEVLGRYPMGRGLTLVLLRLERRILLLSMTTGLRGGGSFTTLAEITDPEEVAQILAHAQEASGTSMAAQFQQLLERSDERLEGERREIVTSPRVARPANQAASLGRRPSLEGHADGLAEVRTRTSVADGLIERLTSLQARPPQPAAASRSASGPRGASTRLRDVSA
jgi:Flagellar biosynthesis protein, FliO